MSGKRSNGQLSDVKCSNWKRPSSEVAHYRSIVTRLSIGRSIKECVYAHTSRCVRCHRCRRLLVYEEPQELSKCSVSMTVYAAEIMYFRRRWSNRDRTATRWRAFILFFFCQAVVGAALRCVRGTRGSLTIFFRSIPRWDPCVFLSVFLFLSSRTIPSRTFYSFARE